MSGLEIVTVAGCISAILTLYHDAAEVVAKIQKKYKERGSNRGRKLPRILDGRKLASSILIGEHNIDARYFGYCKELGQRFAVGDHVAKSGLKHIILRLQTELVSMLIVALQSNDASILLQLSDVSEETREDTFKVLLQLRQRLLTQVPVDLPDVRRPDWEADVYANPWRTGQSMGRSDSDSGYGSGSARGSTRTSNSSIRPSSNDKTQELSPRLNTFFRPSDDQNLMLQNVSWDVCPLPKPSNGYGGFCKGAWQLQVGNRKDAMRLQARPESLHRTNHYWKCSSCNFEGPMTKDANGMTIFDKHTICMIGEIQYRWDFLFKTHLKRKLSQRSAWADFGCIFCYSEGRGTPQFHGIQDYLKHMEEHRAVPPAGRVLSRITCSFDREPKEKDPFDVCLPSRNTPSNIPAASLGTFNHKSASFRAGRLHLSSLEENDTTETDPWNQDITPDVDRSEEVIQSVKEPTVDASLTRYKADNEVYPPSIEQKKLLKNEPRDASMKTVVGDTYVLLSKQVGYSFEGSRMPSEIPKSGSNDDIYATDTLNFDSFLFSSEDRGTESQNWLTQTSAIGPTLDLGFEQDFGPTWNFENNFKSNVVSRSFKCEGLNCSEKETRWLGLFTFENHCILVHEKEDLNDLIERSEIRDHVSQFDNRGDDQLLSLEQKDMASSSTDRVFDLEGPSRTYSACYRCHRRRQKCHPATNQPQSRCIRCLKSEQECIYPARKRSLLEGQRLLLVQKRGVRLPKSDKMNTVKETTTNIDHPSAVAMTSHPMFRFEPLSAPFPMEEYDTLLPASNPVNTIATARDQAADIDSEASLQLVAVGEESANKDRVVSEETGQDQVETDKNSDMAEIFPAGILSRPDSPRLLCDTQGKGPNSAAMIEEVPRQTDVLLTGRALYNHELEEESELSFRELDEVEIVDQSEILGDEGWYKGRLKNTTKIGLLPVLYVETDEEAVERHPPKSSEANATDLTKLSKRALDEPPVLIAHRHKEVVESIDTLSTSTDNMEPLNLNHVWTFQGIMQKQEPVAVVSPLLEHSEQVYRLSAIFKQTLNMPQFLFDGCLGFARLFEPRLKPGKKRIRWTCKCGHQGYDDFIELRWGAVAEYEASLRQYNNGGRQQSASPGGGILSRCTQAIRGIAGSMRNKSSNNDLGLPQFESQHKQINLTSRPSNNALDSLFLLLCIPHQKFATKLLHLELRETSSDREFFGLLMKSYNDMRGRLRSYLSLKSLRTIKFVQFEMYKSELVDIRKVDDVPPIDRKDEYRYRPIPAEIIPPIGENHMMHLCTHPEDADDSDLICLNRIPKKLKERLLVDPARGTGLGWGVHFVEGWRYNVIWLLAFIVLLFSSLVFLICWAVLQHDIQGASGVAAYMLAFVALGIGSIQAAFELN